MSSFELDQMLQDGRRNAVASWLLVAVLVATSVGIVVTTGLLWSLFALLLLVLAAIPPIAHRSPWVMLPWEVLLVAALPVVGLALGSERLAGQFTAYVAVAAIALVLAVELESFTSVRLSPTFATVVVVVTTLAVAALWGLAQWGFDVYLGTSYITTNDELMYDWLYSALAGLFAGGLFTLYFRRRIPVDARYVPAPEEDEAADATTTGPAEFDPTATAESPGGEDGE
jgi:hypothetical protein